MTKNIVTLDAHTLTVDDEDFPILSRHSWRVVESRYVCTQFKTDRQDKWTTVNMYQLLLASNTGVKHLNGDQFDFTKANLAPLTRQQVSIAYAKRSSTKGKPCTSKYKGVTKLNPGKFRAVLVHNKKAIHLGIHETEDDAARAYNQKALEVFGPDAWLNPVPPVSEATDGVCSDD